MSKIEITLKNIYPKPEKYKLFLEKDKLTKIWDEAKEKVAKKLFEENIKNKEMLIDFIALEIIDVDDNYKISKERLEAFKDYNNISNSWLKWSLANKRDIKDINLINSGIEVFNGEDFDKFVKHKSQFSKTHNIDLKKEDLDLMYYKLYKLYGNSEYSTFDKEYNYFKEFPEAIKKQLYIKDIDSKEQMSFYKEVLDNNKNGNLSTKATNFLLNVPYKYIEDFNKYNVDVKKLLDNRMFSSQDYVYKLLEYSTKDESLKLFLAGLSKVGFGMFEKNIDPRQDLEDQIAGTYMSYDFEIKQNENNDPYIIDSDGYEMRIFDDVNLALEKFHNDYILAKNTDKFTFKNEDFRFTLDKLNIPYLHGELEGYKYETHAALIKSPISNDEIFNGEILTEGFKRNDCSNSFKSNYLMGWEMIELMAMHPEDNAYVILKDSKNNEIASMFVSKVNQDLIVDSIQYIKDLNLVKNRLNSDENIEDHYHTKIHELVTMWATECVTHPKGPKTIFFGNGGAGDSPKLRLTNKVANKFGAIIPDETLNNGKVENFLMAPSHPHVATACLDFEGSVEDEVARVLMSVNPRYLNYKSIRETIVENLKSLPDSYDKKEELLEYIKEITKDYKDFNKDRKEKGFEKFEVQEGIFADYTTFSKEFKDKNFKNEDFDFDY